MLEFRIREPTISTSVRKGMEEDRFSEGEVGATAGNAFGLEIRSGFPVSGLLAGSHAGRRPAARVGLELGSPDEIEAAVRDSEPTRLRDWRAPDGRNLQWIDRHGDAGFRLASPDYGSFLISPDGSSLLCAPNPQQPLWQRILVGQLLTHVAVLQGMELFHASAVGIGGRAVGIVGYSHLGKTSLALRLVLRGATFFADDVIAIDPDDRSIVAHPGVGVCNLRHAEAERLIPADRDRLGRVIGANADALRLVIAPNLLARGPLPLGALYFPRRDGSGDDVEFHRVARPDPTLLLANTFTQALRMPERLRRQLDVCARVAQEIPIFEVEVPASVDAATLAERIERHAIEVIAGEAQS